MGEREMTMVDRVARAMARLSLDSAAGDLKGEECWEAHVDDAVSRQYILYLGFARVAIRAMRGMTASMIEGAYARDPLACDVDDKASVYPAIWRGAIDAALSETPTTSAKEP